MYDRTLVFEGKKAADGDAYTVIKNTPELIREIPYELSIPYLTMDEERRSDLGWGVG